MEAALNNMFFFVRGYFTYPESTFYWPYLLGYCAIAFALAKLRGSKSIVSDTFPSRIYGNLWFAGDLAIMLINGALVVFVFKHTLNSVALPVHTRLIELIGTSYLAEAPTIVTLSLSTLLIAAASDAGFFCSHYLHHKVPILWKFHQVHHASPQLTPATFFRNHPMETGLQFFIQGSFLGAALFVATVLTGADRHSSQYLFYQVNAVVFLHHFFEPFRHSHIPIRFPRWSSWFVISPHQHQIHHSSDPRHRDRNFGGWFALPDLLMGTLYVPEKNEALQFGLPDQEKMQKFRSLPYLYLAPFREAAELCLSPFKKRRNL